MNKKPRRKKKPVIREFRSKSELIAVVEQDFDSPDAPRTSKYRSRATRRPKRRVSLQKIFEVLLLRPDMYVMEVSMATIRAYMDGVCFGRTGKWMNRTRPFVGFCQAIWDRYGYTSKDTHLDWVRIIQLKSKDDAEAVELLRKLWKEHIKGRSTLNAEFWREWGPRLGRNST